MKATHFNYNKRKLGFLISIAIILSGLFSCDITPEVTDIKVDNNTPRLVVDGLVSDQPGPYFVRLSLTADVYSKEVEKINNAFVTITDNLGNRDILTRAEDGVYQTDSLVGAIGRTYTLTVVYNGKAYTSTSTMSNGITIDSLGYKFQKESLVYDEGYYLTLFGTEPQEEKNYYRWYIAENDTLEKDIELGDDQFLGAELKDIMIERKAFDKGDTARVEVHSLSETEYKYYIGLNNVIENDGGLFSSPPKNPEGNISNGALGIFRASKVSIKEVVIE
jgi:hypothetical protein